MLYWRVYVPLNTALIVTSIRRHKSTLMPSASINRPVCYLIVISCNTLAGSNIMDRFLIGTTVNLLRLF